MNMNWMLTSLALLFNTATNCLFMARTLEKYQGVALPQQLLTLIGMSYICYFCEYLLKREFLQRKYNRKLKIDFKRTLEVIPDGLTIYDPNKKNKVIIANTEFKRLVG